MPRGEADGQTVRDWAPSVWRWDGHAFSEWARRWVDHDDFVVWLMEPARPMPEGLLACVGMDDASARAWLDQVGGARERLEQVMHSGAWSGDASELGLAREGAVAAGGCWIGPGQRFGLLALAVRKDGFHDGELDAMHWISAALRSRLATSEAGSARMLVGSMGRLLYADPICRLQAISEGLSLSEVVDRIEGVLQQRWPELAPGAEGDMVMMVGAEPRWVAVQRRRAVDVAEAEHWVIEMRRMEAPDLPVVEELEDRRLAAALRFIHERYAESPSLGDIADASEMSPYHFHRVFSRGVGISPRRYLQLRQVQMAKWRLRTERTGVGAIAEETGFANHGHFASAFRRAVGLSPTRYRERWMNLLRSGAD